MKKDYLLYLKKALSVGCMVAGLGLLTGCGEKTTDNNELTFEEEKEDIEPHYHLMVDMGGTTYIFRECDETLGGIDVYKYNGYISFYVYDTNNNLILNQYAYSDTNRTTVDSERQEMAIQEIEETAIEKGAVVYKILSK